MRLIRVMMAVVILSMLAGVFSQTAWAGPVSVGIAIGVPAPVVVYPAPVYYPPAYAYGPPPTDPGSSSIPVRDIGTTGTTTMGTTIDTAGTAITAGRLRRAGRARTFIIVPG